MNALTDVHLFLIGFTTEASWPSLHNKQNEPDRQSRATVTTRMSKEPQKTESTTKQLPETPKRCATRMREQVNNSNLLAPPTCGHRSPHKKTCTIRVVPTSLSPRNETHMKISFCHLQPRNQRLPTFSTFRSASDKAKVGLSKCAFHSSWRTAFLPSIFVAEDWS